MMNLLVVKVVWILDRPVISFHRLFVNNRLIPGILTNDIYFFNTVFIYEC